MNLSFMQKFPNGELTDFEGKINRGEKIHTIRKGHRWVAGDKIHYCTRLRTSEYNQFKHGVCSHVQHIQIAFYEGTGKKMTVLIDGRPIKDERVLEKLVRHDGLTTEQFIDWFHRSTKFGKQLFDGQIVHFTPFKYEV